MGYLEAAQLLGQISAVLMVLAAGVGAWALAGPLAAPVAALIAAWMPLIREGGLWVNHYPLLGAACGLALAAGAAFSRWGRAPWVVVAGLCGGAAASLDVRGEAVLLAVAFMILASTRWRSGWRRAALIVLCLAGAASIVPAHAAWLDRAFSIPELRFEEQLRVQRAGVLGQIQGGTFNNPDLEQACAGLQAGPMDMAGLTSQCSEELRSSATDRLSEGGSLPGVRWLWLLPLVALPLGAGRRSRLVSSMTGAVVFGLPVVALWVGMGWVTYFPRYVLPFASVIAMALPVVLHRLIRVGSVSPRWTGGVAAAVSLGLALQVWPGTPQPLSSAKTSGAGADRAAGYFARWVQAELGTEDSMVDCAGLAVDSLLLPSRIDYLRFPPGDVGCVTHISSPARHLGSSYLITMHTDLPEHAVPDAHSRAAIAKHGWVPVQTQAPDGYQLWCLECR